jgi:hypothetical protein
MYHNRITGPLPSSVAGMSALEDIVLYGTILSGTIPASL